MTQQGAGRDQERREGSTGGGFGRMGGKAGGPGGYGQLASTAEEEAPVEESGGGAYGALYAEDPDSHPGGYGELSRPDEDEEDRRSEN